jgi:precorrin-2/cobalt-factor-2 C20-methyltransferase
MPAVLEVLRRHDRADDAVFGAALGLAGEQVGAAVSVVGEAPYLSTLLVPARRGTRGSKLTDTGSAS